MENILNKFGSEEETKLNLPTLKLAFSNYYVEFKKFMPKGDISSQDEGSSSEGDSCSDENFD